MNRRARKRITTNWKKELDSVGWDTLANEMNRRKVAFGAIFIGDEAEEEAQDAVREAVGGNKASPHPGVVSAVCGLMSRTRAAIPGRELSIERQWWPPASRHEHALMVGYRATIPPTPQTVGQSAQGLPSEADIGQGVTENGEPGRMNRSYMQTGRLTFAK
jgi:hypothetical protein